MEKKEIKKEKVEDQNVLDILLDEDNEDPITLYDAEEKPVKFDQVAIIPRDEKLYAILKPVEKMEGVADDEALVFRIDEHEDGEATLIVEADEKIAIAIFDEYSKLVKKATKK